MSFGPRTLEECLKHGYGAWAGSSGAKYQQGRCCEEVYRDDRWARGHQCNRKNGHGPEGLYCKQHDPAVVKARRSEQSRKDYEKQNEDRKNSHGKNFYNVLKQIADGHNDARTLASETLSKFHDGDFKLKEADHG